MTSPIFQGNLKEQLERAHEEREIFEEEVRLAAEKEEKLKQFVDLCEQVKKDVIRDLDDKYHFNHMGQFIEKFDGFLVSLDNYIQNPKSKEYKESLQEQIPVLKEITEFFKNLREG